MISKYLSMAALRAILFVRQAASLSNARMVNGRSSQTRRRQAGSLSNNAACYSVRVLLALLLAIFSSGCQQKPVNPIGTWHGLIKNNSGEQVAFTLEVKRDGEKIVGSLVNGNDRTLSTDGAFDGNKLTLQYDFYDASLGATIDGDKLDGTFTRQWQKQTLSRELHANRSNVSEKVSDNPTVNISGEWVIKAGEAPKQTFWRAAFHQQGGAVTGTIIPVSGDWGELAGTFENGELRLNRFDGINCRIFSAKLTPQGTLEGIADFGLFDPVRKVVAERITENNKEVVASLPDPLNYTRMSNPGEPFRFSFPDLDGKAISSTDDRFKNKVVVASITGTWCPNCHEEAPFLQEMYDRYKAQGLEVVALAFEYSGDAPRDLKQLKVFAQRYGLTYPVLLAGSTDEGEIQKKLPQLVNFGAYPTTIFIGRDGLVKRIHAGFEGKATGERFTKLKAETEQLVKELLAGKES
ncbi:MAG: TlpA family protein disulfide reductase [Acidobacteriota bacterium]|nr:TlpA family protein disulfide reductase [Acidobacteriota bacterium]